MSNTEWVVTQPMHLEGKVMMVVKCCSMVVMTGSVTFATSQDTWQETAGSGEVVHHLQVDLDTGQEEGVEAELVVAGSMVLAITVENMGTRKLTVGNLNLMPISAPRIGQVHAEMKWEELQWRLLS